VCHFNLKEFETSRRLIITITLLTWSQIIILQCKYWTKIIILSNQLNQMTFKVKSKNVKSGTKNQSLFSHAEPTNEGGGWIYQEIWFTVLSPPFYDCEHNFYYFFRSSLKKSNSSSQWHKHFYFVITNLIWNDLLFFVFCFKLFIWV
jgi:hypothetical protein